MPSFGPTSNSNTGANTTENAETRFLPLESTLEQFQENARHIGIIVSDFSPKSQEILNQKIHTMISGLQVINPFPFFIPLHSGLFQHLSFFRN